MTALITLNILASFALLVTVINMVQLYYIDLALDAVVDWLKKTNERIAL